MAYIVPDEIPECCADCAFHDSFQELWVRRMGLYKKISCCLFAPDEIKDPYRDFMWMCENKEEWCPLKEVGGKEK